MEKIERTFGEERVRVSFNPSNENPVDSIKRNAARMIDLLQNMREGASPEKQRLISLAQTTFEEAAMWGVKAATSDLKQQS